MPCRNCHVRCRCRTDLIKAQCSWKAPKTWSEEATGSHEIAAGKAATSSTRGRSSRRTESRNRQLEAGAGSRCSGRGKQQKGEQTGVWEKSRAGRRKNCGRCGSARCSVETYPRSAPEPQARACVNAKGLGIRSDERMGNCADTARARSFARVAWRCGVGCRTGGLHALWLVSSDALARGRSRQSGDACRGGCSCCGGRGIVGCGEALPSRSRRRAGLFARRRKCVSERESAPPSCPGSAARYLTGLPVEPSASWPTARLVA
jgi:hypothetical protein